MKDAIIWKIKFLFYFKSHFYINKTRNNSTLYVITVISYNFVRYNHEIHSIKYAKSNQMTHFVRYNRVFVITVIVITEFDCTSNKQFKQK